MYIEYILGYLILNEIQNQFNNVLELGTTIKMIVTFYSSEKFFRKRGVGMNASLKYLSADGKCDGLHIFLGYYHIVT